MGHLERGRVIAGLEGRFTIERKLSRGGAPSAYFARDEQGRALVLTELHATDISDWADVERVIAEARLHQDVVHPLVPPLVDLFATDGTTARTPSELTEAFVRAAEDEGPTNPTALPSLVVARAFVPGESLEQAIARRRPFAPAALERIARSLLSVAETLQRLSPPCVRLVGDPAAIVVDPIGDAHVIRLAAPPARSATGANDAEALAPTDAAALLGDDLRAIGELVLAAASHVPARMWPRDTSTGAIAVGAIVPGLPPKMRDVITGLLGRRFRSVAEARSALDGKPLVRETARAGRKRALLIAAAVGVSLAAHVGLLAIAYRVAHHKPRFHEARSRDHTIVLRPALAPPPPPPAPPPPPSRVEWTGEVTEATKLLARGTPCALAIEISPASPESCSATLACGRELVLPSYGVRCQLLETETNDGFVYEPRIADVNFTQIVSVGRDVTVFGAADPNEKLHVKLAAASLPSRYSLPHALGPTHFPTRQSYAGMVVGVTGVAAVNEGTRCTFTIDPVDELDANCRGTVRCGDATLYAGRSTSCPLEAGVPSDFMDPDPTPIDGSPSVTWEAPRLLRVADVTEKGAMSVDIYLNRDKPKHEGDN